MPNGHREATRLLQVVDRMVKDGTKSGAGIEVTYGQVFGLSSDGLEASVYLAGSRELATSDGGIPEPSDGFRVPSHHLLAAGDYVRVAIDARGHRWIEEYLPTSAYAKVAIDHANGRLAFGSGSVPPTNYLSVAGDEFGLTNPIRVVRPVSTNAGAYFNVTGDAHARLAIRADGRLDWGSGSGAADASLYRSSTDNLRTDSKLTAEALLVINGASSFDLQKPAGVGVTGNPMTLTTSLQTLPIDFPVEFGSQSYANFAGNNISIPADHGGVFYVSVTVRTSTALAGTSNFRISTRISGVEYLPLSGYETVPPSTAASISRSGVVILNGAETVDVQALAGSGLTGGAAILYLSVIRLGNAFNA